MTTQLVPQELLQRSEKILFVAHLALGDFTYMQNCFRAFAKAYPHIKMHLWVDELRRTSDQRQWDHLRKYSLYDWVTTCGLFDKVYTQTYSPALLKESMSAARAQEYPLVVSFAVLHRHKYVNLMREISPKGFIVGQKKRVRFFDIRKHLIYRKLDSYIPAYKITHAHQSGAEPVKHISAIYAGWFQQLFNIDISPAERLPFVNIPEQWCIYANQQFSKWNFNRDTPTIFLNGFSKSPERSWDLERIVELAHAMQQTDRWRDANFIINVIPEKLQEAKALFAHTQHHHFQLFSADENFFQLPAILSLCNLIISVETAIMHLANAVHVPVIALMRQTSPEWTPINAEITTIIKTENRKDWVDQINVDQVLLAMQQRTDMN